MAGQPDVHPLRFEHGRFDQRDHADAQIGRCQLGGQAGEQVSGRPTQVENRDDRRAEAGRIDPAEPARPHRLTGTSGDLRAEQLGEHFRMFGGQSFRRRAVELVIGQGVWQPLQPLQPCCAAAGDTREDAQLAGAVPGDQLRQRDRHHLAAGGRRADHGHSTG